VSKLAAPALAALVRQRVAEMSGLTPQDVAALVPRDVPQVPMQAGTATRGRRGEPKSSPRAAEQRRIVGLLVNHPELARQVNLPAGARVTPERAEVRSVLERIQGAGADVTPAMALEMFRGLPEEEAVTTSASGIAQELSEGEFDPWPEVSGYFQRWLREEEAEEMNQLLVRISRDEASPAEKDRYGALMQAQKQRNETPESQSKL
jgi:DNA primase